MGSKAPEGQNIGNKQKGAPCIALEGRNFAVFLVFLPILHPSGAKILRGR
jgi:hypothetical protein